MTEREKPDLSTIEPIGPVPDLDDARIEQVADRIGRVDGAVSGAPPVLGTDVSWTLPCLTSTVEPSGMPDDPSSSTNLLEPGRLTSTFPLTGLATTVLW